MRQNVESAQHPGRALLLLRAAVALFAALASSPGAFSEDLRTVILVPGITGSKLRDVETGKVVWGEGRNLIFPRDGAYALARPLGGGKQRLEAFAVIEHIRLLGVIRREIYGPVLRRLEKAGYQRGVLARSRPDDTLFAFAYDFRQDVQQISGLLARALETLRQERGSERLRVSLICQSTGGNICRYLAKYGGVPLEDAEDGSSVGLEAIEIEKLILVGTASGGSLRNLQFLLQGRSYISGFGRPMLPEVLFTFASLLEDLPAYTNDVFIDSSGRRLEIDLFDAANWQTYGWSVFAQDVKSRLQKAGRHDLFGDEAKRLEHLRWALDRARRLHRLLQSDVAGVTLPQYYSVQNADEATISRALLLRTDEGWSTLFPGDPQLERLPGRQTAPLDRMTTPGDGHASKDSQRALSAQEAAKMARPTLYVEGKHFTLILNPAAEEFIVEVLAR